jgi:curli biogenesis system outer membrane secretion channel CsgG
MSIHGIVRARLAVFCAAAVLLGGCATDQGYLTTFSPKNEPSRTLDMDYNGPRANVAVSDFTVKAHGATSYIGDGLREMLGTALFESQRFNVASRQDMQSLTAEQRLSYSKMAAPGSPKLGGKMGVAELLVSGAVTEFEAEASGAGLRAEMRNLPATGGVEGKNAHMAIDIQVVDSATGFIVAARRVRGSAAAVKASIGTKVGGGLTEMPFSLGAFRNTPMELAIRDCIYRSVIYLAEALPPKYFKH